MLVLTRKLNESIIIGDGIEIRVLEGKGNRVRLGITAPDDVRVTRNEIALGALDALGSPNEIGEQLLVPALPR